MASVAAATNTRRRSWPGAPPRLATRVIGRERELIAVAELLAAHRFVTIHGAGGIGKTTLALAVIQAQALAGANDVCFVDLSLSTGAHSVADALASALGLMVRTDDPTASILDFTRDRKMILLARFVRDLDRRGRHTGGADCPGHDRRLGADNQPRAIARTR